MKWYWLTLLRLRDGLSVEIDKRDLLVRRELILHLRPVAHDGDEGVLGAEERGGARLHLGRRDGRNLLTERLRIILRQPEHVDVVQREREPVLRRGLDREHAAQVRLRA